MVSEIETKIDEKKLAEFVTRARDAAGSNLVSIILFGSAAAGDFHPEYSNLNLFCVVRDSSFRSLQVLAPVAKWWDKQKQPPPLLMTRDEIERSADVFTIELLDMQQHHRLVYGEDVLKSLSIPRNLHRIQVEYELREKLSLLRQHFLLASGSDKIMWELMLRSVSSFATLFRHALMVLSGESPVGKRESIQLLAKQVGFDPSAFFGVLDVREQKVNRRALDVSDIFSRYLAAVEQVTSAVDKMLDSGSSQGLQ
jgi:Nucleotidyltransferase domain